jgi:hypothetical protein
MRYSLTSLRCLRSVQSFFGRPIVMLRFFGALPCISCSYLRFGIATAGEASEENERREFVEVKVDENWLKTLEVGDLELELGVEDIAIVLRVGIPEV